MNKMLTAIAVALLAVPAAANAYDTYEISLGTADDGYRFEEKQFDRDTTQVKIVAVRSVKELREIAREKGIRLPFKNKAFATIGAPPVNTCTIYMIDPSVKYEPKLFGHEVMHCFYGNWHPSRD